MKEDKNETEKKVRLEDPGVIDNIKKQTLRKELDNMVAALQAGKLLNKQQRNRLQVLFNHFKKGDDDAAAVIDEAVAAGAFKMTNDGLSTPRITKVELAQRVALVTEWVLEPRRRVEMIRDAAILWGVCCKTIDTYVVKANQELQKAREKRRESILARATAQMQTVYKLAKASGDYSVAKDCLIAEVSMEGVMPSTVQRFEHSGPNGMPMAILDLPAKGSVPPGDGTEVDDGSGPGEVQTD